MLRYEFMQVALLVGVLLAVIIPLIGTNLVFKRLSMTGDALSHTSLAGVAIGLLAGFNPIVTAMIVSVISALIVEVIRKKFQKYSEISLAIVLSVGVGIAGLLSSFTPASNFDSYLFGSIVAITNVEMIMTIVLFVIVIAYFLLFYKEILFISYNENNAKISGVPVNLINFSYTVISALTIAIATKTIGALLVSSLIVIPVASALQIAKSYKATIIFSIIISLISVVSGIIISFYLDLKPGGTIVLVSVAILALTMVIKPIIKKIKRKNVIPNQLTKNM